MDGQALLGGSSEAGGYERTLGPRFPIRKMRRKPLSSAYAYGVGAMPGDRRQAGHIGTGLGFTR
jgi:hypothetical protein